MWITTEIGGNINVSNMVHRIGPRKPFRNYIKKWRTRRGLTQERLADLIETTKTSISRWENGTRDPTTQALAAIAYVLDIEIADLFRDPDRPSADALLAGATEEETRTAIALIETFLKRTGTSG
ncbi:MAG TPA: hypothetical protein DCO82_09260 [Alphaproteobacteria bacterium]|nr:hypothetical protein [Alphaproteobacteria bacterium]